jgi:hypothetical protein
MRLKLFFSILLIIATLLDSCKKSSGSEDIKIVFLHHSVGQTIWDGNRTTKLSGFFDKISNRLSVRFYKKPALPESFKRYNKAFNTNYSISEIIFPKDAPYGWHNYPFDYYNIWVKNAGNIEFMEEPTLELLTKKYQVIIFKHCFPVSNIKADLDTNDVNSDYKSLSNYKLQYHALRQKLSEFPDTKFILFTGAARVKSQISEDEAKRAKEFFKWVVEEWDHRDDNIYIWDFYSLQTEGGIYFKDTFAQSVSDSHPNKEFAAHASELMFNRVIDILKTNGSETTLTGEHK